jgi:hypothetical protein
MQTVQSTVSGTAAKTYEVDFLGLLYYDAKRLLARAF